MRREAKHKHGKICLPLEEPRKITKDKAEVEQRCHNAEPFFQRVKPLTLLASLKSLSLRLWDDQRKQLVGFSSAKLIRRSQDA